jgi:FKBP-type peptidyl-prolyl cis-trans isomerase
MKQSHLRIAAGALLPLLLAVGDLAAQPAAPGSDSTATESHPSTPEATPPVEAFSSVGSDMAMANHLGEMGWNEAQIAAFIEGIRAAFHGRPYPPSAAARQISERITQQIAAIEAHEREVEFAKPGRLKEYIKDICKRLNLEQADSGLCYTIRPGTTEARPGPDDTVVVSCAAFAADGSTPIPQLTAEKARTKVSEMLPGFVEGIQMMSVGGQAIFVLPPALSFGAGTWPPGVDHGTPLLFRITLNEIVSADKPR